MTDGNLIKALRCCSGPWTEDGDETFCSYGERRDDD
nr:MAG TPA: hypothetical protein [Caudoviricetes sp.]